MNRRLVLATLALVVVVTTGCATMSLVETVASLIREAKELLTTGRYDEAIAKLLRAVEKDPKSWEAYLHLARAYIGKSAWVDAIASGRKAFELGPREAEIAKTFGEALLGGGTDALRRGQFADAATRLREYVGLEPGNVGAWLDLGKSLWSSGQRGEAVAAFSRVLELAPGHDEALRFLLRQ